MNVESYNTKNRKLHLRITGKYEECLKFFSELESISESPNLSLKIKKNLEFSEATIFCKSTKPKQLKKELAQLIVKYKK